MAKKIFTKEMIEIISSMKGKTMVSYQCPQIDKWSRTYGFFRINMEDYAIEFSNEEKEIPFFDRTEEVAGFECKKVDLQKEYSLGVLIDNVFVDEKVKTIEIITDKIKVEEEDYEITFDNALIFHTEHQTIMFSRDTWFSELINISDNDDFDSVFPIEKVIEEWNCDGDYKVSVKRTKRNI